MACNRFGRCVNRTNLLSNHGRFMFDRAENAAWNRWHPEMRRTGASERDCATVASAFLYEGLFYTNIRQGMCGATGGDGLAD